MLKVYDALFIHLLREYPALRDDRYITSTIAFINEASRDRMFETIYSVLVDLNDHLREAAPAVFQDKRYLELWHAAAQYKTP